MNTAELRSALDEVRERFDVPSYSATFYYKGEFHSVSGGMQDIEKGIASSENTLYAIGSCSKSFTVGALCSLIDKGILSLEDPVRKFIPEFEMYDSYVTEHLTVRDILCHRSGLPRHELAWYSRLDTLKEKDIIAMLKYLKPNKPFRYAWQYNNQMYAIAGYIIRRVTGKMWYEVVRENIFKPLGITNAAFSPEEALALGNCAVAYIPDKETKRPCVTPYADIGEMGSAGCIYMSTAELAKWDAMLLNKGELNGVRVLSEKMVREMTTPQMLRPLTDIPPAMSDAVSNVAYGLGFMTEVFEGHRLVHHGGHIDGFMADQSFLPDDGFVCSILTNYGEVRGALVMRYVAHEKFLGGSADWSSTLQKFFAGVEAQTEAGSADIMARKPENAPCPVPVSDICGTYREPAYGEITVSEENGELRVAVGTLVFIGKHYANNYFYLELPHVFPGLLIEACVDIKADGSVSGFSAAFNVEDAEKIRFIRQ